MLTVEQIEEKALSHNIEINQANHRSIANQILSPSGDRIAINFKIHQALESADFDDDLLKELDDLPENVEFHKAEKLHHDTWLGFIIFRVTRIQKEHAEYEYLRGKGLIK